MFVYFCQYTIAKTVRRLVFQKLHLLSRFSKAIPSNQAFKNEHLEEMFSEVDQTFLSITDIWKLLPEIIRPIPNEECFPPEFFTLNDKDKMI